MSAFRFYTSTADRMEVLGGLLKLGLYTLLPNLNYSSDCPRPFTEETDELWKALEINPSVYVRRIGAGPMGFMQLAKGAYAGTFVVDANKQGGALMLSLPMALTLGPDHVRYPPGLLACPDRVWNEQCSVVSGPPPALKQDYTILKGFLTKALHRIKTPEPCWLGTDALQKFEIRQAELLVNGVWIKCDRTGLSSTEAN